MVRVVAVQQPADSCGVALTSMGWIEHLFMWFMLATSVSDVSAWHVLGLIGLVVIFTPLRTLLMSDSLLGCSLA